MSNIDLELVKKVKTLLESEKHICEEKTNQDHVAIRVKKSSGQFQNVVEIHSKKLVLFDRNDYIKKKYNLTHSGDSGSINAKLLIEEYEETKQAILDAARKLVGSSESSKPKDDEVRGESEKRMKSEKVLNTVNTILYGPPGTGKTYNSIIYAVNTIDSSFNGDYDAYVKRFNELKDAGQIAFTTFHQSYGYEEFIEGIKPITTDKEEVIYKTESGIFKKFCELAKGNEDYEQAFELFISELSSQKFSLKKGSAFVVTENNDDKIKINNEKNNEIILELDKLKALVLSDRRFETVKAVSEFNNHRPNQSQADSYYFSLWNEFQQKYGHREQSHSSTREEKNVVFIIDEINRGNISKIFGELITLIEDSKREGAKEAMSVTLPYSGETFSVPNNVYILGTMNTADRSIALMDTALRRRFEFVEMMPDTSTLAGVNIEGIEINKMLEIMNKRIELLYDREHTLGHAFFMGLKKEPTIDNLAKIFQNKIIPLLQEYFYEDYEKIMLVLGIDPSKDTDKDFISKKKDNDLFAFALETPDIQSTYQINTEAFKSPENYLKIYPQAIVKSDE